MAVQQPCRFKVGTGWRYRNGGAHFAYDYLTPVGSELFAVADGVVGDLNDGVRDQPRGIPAGRGAPSNWLLLWITHGGKRYTVFYQHLRAGGFKVRKGQRVTVGQVIATSGNSGNTTGPHTHVAVMRGWVKGPARYSYLARADGGAAVFPPSKVYQEAPKPVEVLGAKPGPVAGAPHDVVKVPSRVLRCGRWERLHVHDTAPHAGRAVELSAQLHLALSTAHGGRPSYTKIRWARLGWGSEASGPKSVDTTGTDTNAVPDGLANSYQHLNEHTLQAGGPIAVEVWVQGPKSRTVTAPLVVCKVTPT